MHDCNNILIDDIDDLEWGLKKFDVYTSISIWIHGQTIYDFLHITEYHVQMCKDGNIHSIITIWIIIWSILMNIDSILILEFWILYDFNDLITMCKDGDVHCIIHVWIIISWVITNIDSFICTRTSQLWNINLHQPLQHGIKQMIHQQL